MRKGRHHGQLKWITEISVTPLMDLVFILLFAFMVALPLVSRTDSLLTASITNPSTTSAVSAPTPENTITVVLSSTGSLRWEGLELPIEDFELRLNEAVQLRPALGVILEMPPELPVTRLIAPMAALRSAGVQSTAIRLTPAPS